jgi:hypothetical protein
MISTGPVPITRVVVEASDNVSEIVFGRVAVDMAPDCCDVLARTWLVSKTVLDSVVYALEDPHTEPTPITAGDGSSSFQRKTALELMRDVV